MNQLLGQQKNQALETQRGESFAGDSPVNTEAALAQAMMSGSTTETPSAYNTNSLFDGGQFDADSPFAQEALKMNGGKKSTETSTSNFADQLRTIGGTTHEATGSLGINTRPVFSQPTEIFRGQDFQTERKLSEAQRTLQGIQERPEKPESLSVHSQVQASFEQQTKAREEELLKQARKQARRSRQLGATSGRQTLLNKERSTPQSTKPVNFSLLALAERAFADIVASARRQEAFEIQNKRAAQLKKHRGGLEGGAESRGNMVAQLERHAPHELTMGE